MWTIIKIFVVALAGFFPFLKSYIPRISKGEYRGWKYFTKLRKLGRGPNIFDGIFNWGPITYFKVGLELQTPVNFSLSKEKFTDRFFKSLFISNETDTGDKNFDKTVYIACDHPYLRDLLKNEPGIRELILQIFSFNFHEITSDGSVLWLDTLRPHENMEIALDLVVRLAEKLKKLQGRLPYQWEDRFLNRARIAQSIISILFAVGFIYFLESIIYSYKLHVHPSQIIGTGAMYAYPIGGLLCLFIFLSLKGSSKAHKVFFDIYRFFIFVIIVLPSVGTAVVSFINTKFDSGPDAKYIMTIRSLSNPRQGRYNLRLQRDPNIRSPEFIDISKETFTNLESSKKVEITIAPGKLGFPWYRDFTPVE